MRLYYVLLLIYFITSVLFDSNQICLCVNNRNSRVVRGMGGILHNMLYRVAAARQPIRDEDAVNIFQRFRECSDAMIACKALILQVRYTWLMAV